MPDNPQQGELPLEAPPLPEDAPFLPARMVNEYVYAEPPRVRSGDLVGFPRLYAAASLKHPLPHS